MNIKKGFTLAEVLITLAVIGVVAALTLSTLIKKYQQHIAINQLKKAYSTLGQIIQLSEEQNGDIKTWNFENNTFDTYILPYFKVLKSCKNCRVNYTVKAADGSDCDYTNFSICHRKDSNNLVYTTDGMLFSFANSGASSFSSDNFIPYLQVEVDINGSKKPNIYSKDIFKFEISPNYGLKPYGYGERNSNWNRYGFLYENNGTSIHVCQNNKKLRFYCTAKIITDGWKISDDYPW